MMQRRAFITGIVSLLAAPAIVKVESLMPISVVRPTSTRIVPWREFEHYYPLESPARIVSVETMQMTEYIERVVEPRLKAMANDIAEQVLFKQTYCWFEGTQWKTMGREEFEAKYGRG